MSERGTPAAKERIIGGHRLLSKLGQGGMGTVYKAVQLSMDRIVALKVMRSELAKDQGFVERFLREARASGRISSPHVVACHDVGIDHGIPYMSLELLEGGDAVRLMRKAGGRLDEGRALALLRDCCIGLQAVHAAGLIHRDIKPHNIFIDADGRAKLADLGLARREDGDDRLTMTGQAMGSPAYMSPEQARGASDLDIRSDIHALGATVYHLLTGHPPYNAGSLFATVHAVINAPVPDPRGEAPGLSVGASALVRAMLAKEPGARPQTPEELLEHLDNLLDGSQQTVSTAMFPGMARRRARWPWAVAALVVAGAGAWWWRAERPRQVVQPEAPVLTQVATAPVRIEPPTPTPSLPVAIQPSATRAPMVVPVPAVAAPVVVAAPLPATSQRVATRVEPAIPTWAPQAAKALDALLAGRGGESAQHAAALPRQLQPPFLAASAARIEFGRLLRRHADAVIEAAPKLSAMPEGKVIGVTDKGLALGLAGNASTVLPWRRLTGDEWEHLRSILEPVARKPGERRTILLLGQSRSEDLLALRDPELAGLSEVVAVVEAWKDVTDRERVAAARRAEADRAEARRSAGRVFELDTSQASDPAVALIAHLGTRMGETPRVLSGTLDGVTALDGLVIIDAGCRLLPGAVLLPRPGGVVLLRSEQVAYQPTQIEGLPFVSISPLYAQSSGAEGGRTWANAVFFGNVLLDTRYATRFERCAFMGGRGERYRHAIGTAETVRRDQYASCDFFRLMLHSPRILASTGRCGFLEVRLAPEGGPGAMRRPGPDPARIEAWDPQRSLIDLPRIEVERMAESSGPFGPDLPLVAEAIDQVAGMLLSKAPK